jgi:hypothetical protein
MINLNCAITTSALTDDSRAIAAEYEYNNLLFASESPALDDVLPLPGDNETCRRVSTDLVLPYMVCEGRPDLFNRQFTRMTRFQSLIQATYLSSLVTTHINADAEYSPSRDTEVKDLDVALHSFCSALIVPPHQTTGRYCGAYGVRTR